MATFKEGDWVRCVDNTLVTGLLKLGAVYRVERTSPKYVYVNGGRGMLPSRFEPWTPKVGERVRCVEGTSLIIEGKEYAVERVSEGDIWVDRGGKYGVSDYPLHYFEPLPVSAEAQPEAPAPPSIRAGGFYKTRAGRKVGPIVVAQRFEDPWPWKAASGMTTYYFKHDGFSCPGSLQDHRDKDDLIAEWPSDTTTTNVAATVDALDEEYGPGVAVADVPAPRFYVGDLVRGYAPAYGMVTGRVVLLDETDPSQTYKIRDERSGVCVWINNSSVEEPTPTTAIVCKIDNGQPLPATRPRVHDSVEAADKEAARLAGLHKGQEFGVFAMTGTPHKVEKVYDHEWQRLAAAGERIRAVKALSAATGLDLHSARDAIDGWKRRAA